jgi:sugar-specific transcriptional regulator TrmB
MNLKKLLSTFNLDSREQETYLILTKYEWLTVLELSKKCSIKRSTLYRVIDSLMKKGLVEMRIDDKTTYYKSSSPENFESLILNKQKKINQMRSALSQLKKNLPIFAQDNDRASVSFHRGIRGIMTIEWKMCSQKNSKNLIFGNDKWWQFVGNDFAEEIRKKTVANNIQVREILNKENFDPTTPPNSWTQISAYQEKHYQDRYISRKILPIDNELYITKNSLYIYSLNPDDIVGIEINNKAYAQMMKSLFELIWKQSKNSEEIRKKN